MNKLDVSSLGGFPVVLDDIDFSQNSTRDALKGITTMLSGNYLLSGCNFSAGNYLPGYMVINGEVLKFDGAPYVGVDFPNVAVWDILNTYDAAGNKPLESGGTAQAYNVRKARIISVHNSLAVNYMNVGSEPTFASKMVTLIAGDNAAQDLAAKILAVIAASGLYAPSTIESWKEIGAVGQPAFQNAWANNFGATRKAQFRKNTYGLVSLRGSIAGNNGNTIFTLPVGYRPAAGHEGAFPVANVNGTNTVYAIFVDSNGNVSMAGPPAGAVGFCLDGVNFYAG